MKIASLLIRSYKSFLEPTMLEFTPNFNVLIGPNNCGKTNILDAVDFLAHPEKNPSRLRHHRAVVDMRLEFTPEEAHKLGLTGPVVFRARKYMVQCVDENGRSYSDRTREQIVRRIKILRLEDFDDIARIAEDYTRLAEDHPQIFENMMQLLREYFPEVDSITKITNSESEDFGAVAVGPKTITIDRLGGGFRRVLVMLLYVLHPDYSLILIDEPETHLHPSMIKRLLKIFTTRVENQVIVTTHSPFFIRPNGLQEVFRILKDERGSHAYYLSQNESRINMLRLVQELNADNLEMFFADKVLLVEGVSDRILMRGLIDRFYRGVHDIKLIETHGKSNIDVYIAIMNIFNIPFLVMLDRDALPMLAAQFQLQGKAEEIMRTLHGRSIYLLDTGAIEQNYPRRYQHKDSKPLNALFAAQHITPAEYNSELMRNLRRIIESL